MKDVVRVERNGNRIWADIPFDNGRGPINAKQISGVRPKYVKSDRPNGRDRFVAWTYPLDITVCRELRQVFGDRLEIGSGLREWAAAEIIRERELRSIQGGDVVELGRVGKLAPKLFEALSNRPYQLTGASFLAAGRREMLADDTGLGKTPQTLAALMQAGAKRVLVFAKKSALTSVWANESEKWLGGLAMPYVVTGPRAERTETIRQFHNRADQRWEQDEVIRFLICNVEMVRVKRIETWDDEKMKEEVTYSPDWPELFAEPWDAVIFDESHRALVGKSHYSKGISQTRLGATRLPFREDGALKIALSATPFRGKVIQAWGTLNWLRPEVFTSYWRFAEQWFGTEDNEYGGKIVVSEDVLPDRRADFDKMMGPYVLRRTKAEVAPDLPPKMYAGTQLDTSDEGSPVGIWLDMNARQKAAYDSIENQGKIELEGGSLTPNGHLAQWTRMKQFATCYAAIRGGQYEPALPSNKYDWLLDHLDEYGGKILVFSQFTKVVNLFAQHLLMDGHPNYVLTGETKQADRDRMQEMWQDPAQADGCPRVMLLNTLAGGESITLDQADEAVFLDETWIPDEQEQAEGRIHRVSRVHPCTYYYLRSRGTIEVEIAQVAQGREYRTHDALDGPRGIEFSRQLLAAVDSR
jgi:SNF2 family DNA or RNA helicase